MGKSKWSTEDTSMLINHMESRMVEFTTGVKEKFYSSFLISSGLRFWKQQVKTKCSELVSTYKTWRDKFSASGFGVEETDGGSISEMLAAKFPYYSRMDEIFGSRPNITPPVLLEAGLQQADSSWDTVVGSEQLQESAIPVALSSRALTPGLTANNSCEVPAIT
jgi:hypothetical protein